MHPQSTRSETQTGSPPTLLEEFVALPLEVRAVHIQESGEADLRRTVQHLQKEPYSLPQRLEMRLAWAVAFNMEGVSETDPDHQRPRGQGVRSYRETYARFADLWTELTKVRTSPKSGQTAIFLDELARSVLCEYKAEWQEPLSRPIDVGQAEQAFACVYTQNKEKVLGDVRRRFGERADSPEAVADEAWAQVFLTYWSPKATRRFLGLSQISTLVRQVAHYVAIDSIREKGALMSTAGGGGSEEDSPGEGILERIGVVHDPAEHIAARQLEQKVTECVRGLPARQHIVAEMVWLRGVSAQEVAERLHISESAVSQLLKKARETLASNLRQHGFNIP